MNIFEYLGLEEKYRSQAFQLVRHYDEVTVEKNKTDFPYDVDVKYDGNFCAVVLKDGEAHAFSRNGKEFNNLENVLKLFKKAKSDGVYMGEIYVDKDVLSLEKLSGAISPFRKAKLTKPMQEKVDTLTKYAAFDFITLDEFTGKGLDCAPAGKSETPSVLRREALAKNLKKVFKKSAGRVHFVETKECGSIIEIQNFFGEVTEKGGEGVVIKGKGLPWVSGHKNFHWMKMVKGVSYELECIGMQEGEGKMEGKVGKLVFRFKDGKEVLASLGKGWTHEDAEKMFKQFSKKKKTVKGKVFEVYALEESSKGILRLPKVGELRHDKEADF